MLSNVIYAPDFVSDYFDTDLVLTRFHDKGDN